MPATRNFILDKGRDAAAAITKFRAVKFTANTEEVTPVTASTDVIDGVAQFDVTAAEIAKGKGVVVAKGGATEWEAGGVIAEGGEVMCDTVGRCIAATGAGNRVHGIAEQAASGTGVRIRVSLTPNTRVI